MIATAIGWLGGSFSFAGVESGAKHIYVANYATDSLSIFPLGSNGNVASLFGSDSNVPSLYVKIQLSNPSGIAYHAGNLYVTDHNDSITLYPTDATGRPRTTARISGSETKLYNPGPIAVDAAGNIYVINTGAQDTAPTLTSYAAGSNGNIAPKTIIKGPNARLDAPTAIATDAQGNIYVTKRQARTAPRTASWFFPPVPAVTRVPRASSQVPRHGSGIPKASP